jgi:hypothetical protein
MKKNHLSLSLLISIFFSISACTTTPIASNTVSTDDSNETLYIYEDGRMEFDSRFIDDKDVVIYSDGYGGEKAAVKVRVPIHSDFYRNSIVVVRVVNKFEESVGQNESDEVININ